MPAPTVALDHRAMTFSCGRIALQYALVQIIFALAAGGGALALRRSDDQLIDITSSTSVEVIDYKQYLSGVMVFGDSTVDCGNNNYLPATVVKSNFKPYGRKFEEGKATGRFCDGKTATDFITERIGYPLGLPYLSPDAHGDAILTGVNFASSASGWDENTAKHFNVVGLTTQFSWFKAWKSEVESLVGQEKATTIISKALYVISTGSNDWVNNYFLNVELMNQHTPESYTTFLINLINSYVKELYGLGSRNIVLLALPPLGCLPSQISIHGKGKPGCVQDINDVAVRFNQLLQAEVDSMKASDTLHGARLVYLDTYNPLSNYVHNPQQYGFNETRKGCCGTGVVETAILCNMAAVGTCKDGDSHVWWDSFHPTAHAYSLLADDLWSQAMPHILAPPLP